MFTSRAEYRLLLRQDNADLRLMEKGYSLGLISKDNYEMFLQKKSAIEKEIKRLKSTRIKPGVINPVLAERGGAAIKEDASLLQLLRRPEVRYADIASLSPSNNGLSQDAAGQVEIQVKYDGYIARQADAAVKSKKFEEKRIPADFVFKGIPGLSREIVEKLEEIRPVSLGQAGRIPGVTPAAVTLLMVALERKRRG